MVVACFADEIAESYQADLEQAEWLLSDRARQHQKLTAADYAFLSRLGWDEVKARQQFSRVTQALNQQAICGRPEDREAAMLEAETAAAVYAKEQPKLEAKIEELTAKLNGLERDHRLSQKRVEQQLEACKKTREFAPLYIRQQVDAARAILLNEGVGRTLRDAQSRHQELVCILNHGNVYNHQENHINVLRRCLPEAVSTTIEGRMMRHAFSAQWPVLKAAASAEFAELNQRIPALQSQFDSELAAIESPLDYYNNPPAND